MGPECPTIAEPKRLSGPLGSPITSLVFSADDGRLAGWALLQNTVLVWNITGDASAAEPLSACRMVMAFLLSLSAQTAVAWPWRTAIRIFFFVCHATDCLRRL
jgi:hypothetical protein